MCSHRHATLHLCESRGFQIYDDLRDDGEHRGLQQQTSGEGKQCLLLYHSEYLLTEEEGFVEVPNVCDEFIRVEGGEEEIWRDEKEEGEEVKEKQGNEWGTEDEEVGVPKVSLKTAAEPDEEEKESSSSDEVLSIDVLHILPLPSSSSALIWPREWKRERAGTSRGECGGVKPEGYSHGLLVASVQIDHCICFNILPLIICCLPRYTQSLMSGT